MSNLPAKTNAGRQANGRFGAGNPGRPRGARNRVAHRVALAILEDFEANQDELLDRLRQHRFSEYLRLVMRLLPASADVGLADYSDLSDEELAEKIGELRLALDWVENGEGTLLDLEGVLVGELVMIDDETP